MAAHRDEFPLCPRCKRPLEALGNGRLVCGDSISCGVLLRDDTLRELLVLGTEIDAATFVLPMHDGKRGVAIQCPCCTVTMAQHELYGVIVDRCPEHGIWFDTDELGIACAVAKRRLPYGKFALATFVVAELAIVVIGILAMVWTPGW